ncbi:hypothetical protein GCM10009717_28310 [Agromyces allii]|uniref:Mucin-associated surface protein n=2 Tax=Agromyces allii TaxID=393607 RepID=A0ABN2QXJ5_9MICO
MRHLTRRPATIVATAALALMLGLGLTSCAPPNDDTAAAMHASVVSVSERAASADYAGALAELDLLEADVDAASADGALDPAQEQQIREAIALVRADLVAAEVATTPTPTPATDDSEDSDDSGNSDDSPGNSGGNKGKGNGKDKDKGKDD